MDHFCYLCLLFVFVMLYCLFLAALWSLAGKGQTSWLSCVRCLFVFCHFLIRCPGSGVALDCNDSRSLSSYLLRWYLFTNFLKGTLLAFSFSSSFFDPSGERAFCRSMASSLLLFSFLFSVSMSLKVFC